ncbi:hypothetical protein JTB14_021472 [Gonioctena quinquepunctata]|nr:hypothetical protein JTB14_021472 [Gonioctena quinquepunctata]
MDPPESKAERLLCCFKSETGEVAGDMMDISRDCTLHQLTMICNAILQQEDPLSYIFYVDDTEITHSLEKALENSKINTEGRHNLSATGCFQRMPCDKIPDGKHLASGSGDTTVRFWDVNTQTASFTCKQHSNWVLCIAWSPDSMKLASACKDGKLNIWDPFTGKQLGKTMVGHKQWITSLSWEPYHKNPECRLLASSSKDGDVRIWDSVLCQTVLTILGHTKCHLHSFAG